MTTALLLGSLLVGQAAGQAAPATAPAESTPPAAEAVAAAQAAQKAAEAARAAADAAALAAQAAAQAAGVKPNAPPPAPPPPATVSGAAAATAESTSGLVDLNVIWLTGNSNTLTFSANGAVSHTFQGGWILGGKAMGQYGQTQAAGTTVTQVNALAAGGQVRADKVLVPETSIYLLGGAETDHVASLELRYFGEGGAGIFWINQKEGDFQKVLLRTDIGFRVAEDNRWEYYASGAAGDRGVGRLPDLTFVGPRFGVAFRYALNHEVVFEEAADVMENIDMASRTLVDSSTKLSAHLTKQFSFVVSFLVTYDSEPAPGKVATNTALTIGLEAAF